MNRLISMSNSSGAKSPTKRYGWTLLIVLFAGILCAGTIVGANATTGLSPSTYTPVNPLRLLDTRSTGKVGALDGTGDARMLQVTGTIQTSIGNAAVVPLGSTAAAFNVTVVDGEAGNSGGYVTVYPCGTRPDASNLNFVQSQTVPNAVTSPISDAGFVCFYVYGKAHLLVDLVGYYQRAEDALGSGGSGPQGPQGPQGVEGAMGLQGLQGIAGPAGPQGLQGVAGATGPVGPRGEQGIQGVSGTNGIDGVQGPIGPQGPQGAAGADGAHGPQGVPGADGAQGPQGRSGLDGANGAAGAIGPQGPAGSNGVDGAQGPAGPQGATGVRGPAGPQGETGAQGPAGERGPGSFTNLVNKSVVCSQNETPNYTNLYSQNSLIDISLGCFAWTSYVWQYNATIGVKAPSGSVVQGSCSYNANQSMMPFWSTPDGTLLPVTTTSSNGYHPDTYSLRGNYCQMSIFGANINPIVLTFFINNSFPSPSNLNPNTILSLNGFVIAGG
jgi:hypothetical protein